MLSKNLEMYRNKKGYSKSELERKTGISTRTIEFIEHGKVKNPRLDTLAKLAKALDITIPDLIE